ncbi:MAG TPA: hypothetical protein VES95_08465 [Dermatophilaceae bacterium]|nr:hypothetical protein [Dermatophilaceae bacterium]
MRTGEAEAVGRLLGTIAFQATRRAARLHEGVAERVFANVGLGVGPAASPVRVAHDAMSRTAYRVVGDTLYAVGELGGSLAESVAESAAHSRAEAAHWPPGAEVARSARAGGDAGAGSALAEASSLADSPGWGRAIAVLGGLFGDWAAHEVPALTPCMTVRRRGRVVPQTPEGMAETYPDASDRVVVFVHGLVETEMWWRRAGLLHHGDVDEWYGERLEDDLGCTPVKIRYTSGLRVSDNGRDLAELLARLVEVWPRPVTDLALVGHSMGGLVLRSALAQAGAGTPDAEPWTWLVRHTVTLGAPHLGAPLEQGVAHAVPVLRRVPETRWLADVLAARAVGIKDLRHGSLLEDHWLGIDPDIPGPRPAGATRIPLHDGIHHLVVMSTLARRHDSFLGHLFGDLLVQPASAVGESGDEEAWLLPDDQVLRIGGVSHLGLLNNERVYERLVDWLRLDREAEATLLATTVTERAGSPTPAHGEPVADGGNAGEAPAPGRLSDS